MTKTVRLCFNNESPEQQGDQATAKAKRAGT